MQPYVNTASVYSIQVFSLWVLSGHQGTAVVGVVVMSPSLGSNSCPICAVCFVRFPAAHLKGRGVETKPATSEPGAPCVPGKLCMELRPCPCQGKETRSFPLGSQSSDVSSSLECVRNKRQPRVFRVLTAGIGLLCLPKAYRVSSSLGYEPCSNDTVSP